MSNRVNRKRRKKRNWAPYLLILPSFIYLVLFFAWPMVQSLILAVREGEALLTLRAEPERGSPVAGQIPRGTQVSILDRQGNLVSAEELEEANLITEVWFQVRGQEPGDQQIEGWAPAERIRVREEDETGAPIAGSVRPRLVAGANPFTQVHAEPDEDSEAVGELEARAPVEILDQTTLEVWYLVREESENQAVEGWAQSRYVQAFGDGSAGRVTQGDTSQYTTRYIQQMMSNRFFMPALRTTLLLIVIIIPVQFVLAIIMALVIQANPKGSSFFLYIYTIALGVSDLAVGIVWYSVFTQFGYLNSILQGLGLIDSPITYLSATRRHWIIIAIWLAEVWRATAIVMVIVVAGMQAISREVLEAAEIFGATLWQRIRYVILPLLRPSLQVALILRTILAFQVFAVVVVLSGGDVVTVLANETYRQYYDLRNVNIAASFASFILVLSILTAIFYLRAVRTQEEVAGA
jgi:multiple sugar transport system permease protein